MKKERKVIETSGILNIRWADKYIDVYTFSLILVFISSYLNLFNSLPIHSIFCTSRFLLRQHLTRSCSELDSEQQMETITLPQLLQLQVPTPLAIIPPPPPPPPPPYPQLLLSQPLPVTAEAFSLVCIRVVT